jgi:hypothetical protein
MPLAVPAARREAGTMPVNKVRPQSAAVDGVPCLLVKVNGKKVALMGVQGQGGVAATVSRWLDLPHGGEKGRASLRDRTFNVRMDVTDANDPAWHRMYVWPASRIEEGDRVELRVVFGTPERGRFAGKYHRTRYEEVPFEKNDTYAVIGNMATWVDARRVYLKERRMSRPPMRFSPAAARQIAKALMAAASRIERRTRK